MKTSLVPFSSFSDRPGDPAQRARAIAHYERLAAYGGGDGSSAAGWLGALDRLWSRFVRPREIQTVLEVIDARPGETILDVGCGSGCYAKRLTALGARVTALDASMALVDIVRPHVEHALRGDVETLAIGREFDRVLCLGVLDFVADPFSCLHRLARHVRRGGHLIVLVPRRGVLASYYPIAQLLRGIRVNTFTLRELDDLARPADLELLAFRHPLMNSLAVSWRRL